LSPLYFYGNKFLTNKRKIIREVNIFIYLIKFDQKPEFRMWNPEESSLKALVDLLNETQVPNNVRQKEINKVLASNLLLILTHSGNQ